MKSIKVLHVYRTYFPDTQGGLEEVIRQICQSTKDCGIESRVFTLSRSPIPSVLERPEAEVYRTKLTAEIASCSIAFGAIHLMKELVEWADIIHFHFPWPFADVLNLFVPKNKPTMLTYHSDIVRQKVLLKMYKPLMYRFLHSMKAIVATSPNYFATSEVLGKYAEKVEIIPIGLGKDTYPPINSSLTELMRLKVGSDFFLFVGVLRYYKGLHILLEAAKGGDFKVVIVGAGPVERELHEKATKLGLDNVLFLGYITDEEKVALYELSRAVVFPSYLRSEAFGVTLVEGLMYAKPIISCEIGTGTSYVNEHNVTGLVIPPSDSKSLKQAMVQLYRDDALCERFGIAARKRYETFFTSQLMAERYASLYKRLVENF